MEETKYDLILKRLDSQDKCLDQVEQAIARIDRDMADDRKNFDQMILGLSEVRESNKTIINLFARLQTKTKDAIQDAVSEAVMPVQESMDNFVDKKVIKVTPATVEKLTLMSKVSKLISSWKK